MDLLHKGCCFRNYDLQNISQNNKLVFFFFAEVIKIQTTETRESVKRICFNPAPSDGCFSSSAVPLLLQRESLVFHMLAGIMGERQTKNGNRCQLFQRERAEEIKDRKTSLSGNSYALIFALLS